MKPEKIREKLKKDSLVTNNVDKILSTSKFLNKEERDPDKDSVLEEKKMARQVGLNPDLVEDFHKRIREELP